MDRPAPALPALLALLLLAPALAPSADAQAVAAGLRFDDRLFTAVDAAFDAEFDAEGDVWYATEGGLVHVDAETGVRELFTSIEGMPSSYTIGIDVHEDKVYAGTDAGIAIVDRATGAVRAVDGTNSDMPGHTIVDVAVDGEDLWVASRVSGVGRWNLTTDEWTLHNTSTQPRTPGDLRRVIPQPSAVWVTSRDDGLWRHDRASGAWSVMLRGDGLRSVNVLSVLEHGEHVYVGTSDGLQRWTPATGAWRNFTGDVAPPHPRILDLDLIPNAEGGLDVWVATPRGLWQYDPSQDFGQTRNLGVIGDYVLANEWNATHGWLVGTEQGLNHFRDGRWQIYATSAGSGPSNGPMVSRMTAAGVGESGPYLWFGSHQGIMAYKRPTQTDAGAWFNLGPSNHYPGGVVHWMDTEGNTTWFATTNGTFGYDREANRWTSRIIEGTRNLVYGVEVHEGELWIPFFGEGLLAQDLETGVTRTWNEITPLAIPDINLLDLRIQGNDVWVACAKGVFRMDRVTGAVTGFWNREHGIPGGTVYRVLPDGDVVWLGTQDAGVLRLDPATGAITGGWNRTNVAGFEHPDVRVLHREGNNLWAGSLNGLFHLDLTTGASRMYNATNSDLVQDFVQGIVDADGILYLATYSGIARMDLATREFYPMRDGPGVVRGNPPASAAPDPIRPATVGVRIDAPREGLGVAGDVTIRGTAFRFGGAVDRVEIRIGDGPWQTAQGTETWTLPWDASTATPHRPVTLRARAIAGNDTSREAQVTVTAFPTPTTPLSIEDLSADETPAGRAFEVRARIAGDPPLGATLAYKPTPQTPLWTRVEMTPRSGFYVATIPARDVREGELLYHVEARSGPLTLTQPDDPQRPARVTVLPTPRVAVTLTGPAAWSADAGAASTMQLTLENVGTERVTVDVRATGLRGGWVSVDPAPRTLEPGGNATVDATVRVPAAAFSDRTNLTFEVRSVEDALVVATATIPLEVKAAAATAPTGPSETGRGRIPLPGLAPLLAALGCAALLARRRFQ